MAAKSERLYVGQSDEIGVIDLGSGDILEPLDPPGVPSIRSLGAVTPGLDRRGKRSSVAVDGVVRR